MSLNLYASIALALILRRKRDFHQDSQILLKQFQPKPVLKNIEFIPEKGPLLVTMNHYSRPGFFILWAVVAISSALPQNSLWLMTNAWTKRTREPGDRLLTWLSKAFFNRLAEVYGMVTMPAMPPAPEETAERALSIRRVMEKLREKPETILGLAPEGMDFSDNLLGIPHAGTGKMILQVVKSLKRILPVGVYEKDGRLIINFGPPYHLAIPEDAVNLDEMVIRQVMGRIAALLPEQMHGPYRTKK